MLSADRPEPLYFVACAGYLAIGTMAGTAFGGFITSKNALEVFTAIGTVGAVWVALWFGMSGSREKRRSELNRAVVNAARITPQLLASYEQMDVLFDVQGQKFEHLEPETTNFANYDEETWQGDLRSYILTCVSNPSFDLAADTIQGLAPLGDRIATRIAAAIGIVRLVKDQVSDPIAWQWTQQGADRFQRQRDLDRWTFQLRTAQRNFLFALRRCEIATSIHAPEPTGDELLRE